MDTITWNGEKVARTFTAYQSSTGGTVRGKFGGVATYPAEYAVKDQQGLIVKRFSSMSEAEEFAAARNAA